MLASLKAKLSFTFNNEVVVAVRKGKILSRNMILIANINQSEITRGYL
jgi:hypothetical protein